MNSTEAFRNYKHDVPGKFKDITQALSGINEDSFRDSEAHEVFHAIHEVILKMLLTSRRTIAHFLGQEITLVVSDTKEHLDLPKLQLDGIVIRYESRGPRLTYFYLKAENDGPVEIHIGILKALLPIVAVSCPGEIA